MKSNEDTLPELPKLPTKWGFQLASTRPTAMKRSDPLKEIDSALETYSNSRARYETSCRTLRENPSAHSEEQVVKDFYSAVKDFQSADQHFKDVGAKLSAWGPGQHDTRGATGAVQGLWQQLHEGRKVIEDGYQTIDRMSMRIGGPEVPKVNHQIWVGSVPGEDAIRNATLWTKCGFEVNLWTDKNNLLAGDFKSQTKAMRGELEPATPDRDPAIKQRMQAWDDATPEEQRAGLDVRLQRMNPELAQRAEAEARRLQDLQRDGAPLGPGSGITVRDVSELFDPKGTFPEGEQALTKSERAAANIAHQREVGERCNFAASADLLRPIVLHDHPGVYCDVDVTPPIKGMPRLIDTWNGVVAEQVNQHLQDREKFPTDSPNAELLNRKRDQLLNKDDTLDLPRVVVPAWGNSVLDNPAYKHVLGAVEEHMNSLHPGQAPQTSTPRYDELRAYAAKYDPNNRMVAAFDDWKSRTKTLDDALEPIPPLHAPKDGFKALAPSRSQGVGSNAVLASSTPGSAGLRDYTNTVVSNSAKAFEEQRHAYLDDTSRNRATYNLETMQATGPSALVKVLREGGTDVFHPQVRLPHTYAGNFSTAELNHSWWPQEQTPQQGPSAQQTQSPQQREGSRSSSVERPGQEPMQRSKRSSKEQDAAQGQAKTVSRSGSPHR